jgi:tetratricopeptide (TPR) repeat protein
MSRRATVSAALTGAFTLAACTPTPAQRMKSVETIVQKERKPNKLVERGKAFAALGDNTRAAQYFAEALDEGADEHEVLPLLMRSYIVSRRFLVAIQVGEDYVRRHPDDYRLRYLVGTLYVAVGDYKKARNAFEQVLVSAPKHAAAQYALAVVLRDDENDWIGADYHFRQYLKLAPKGPHAEEARASLLKSVP